MRRTDPVLGGMADSQLFFCGDDVYWYATEFTEGACLRPGATWDPNVGMVTVLPPGSGELVNRRSVSPEALEEMAAAAVALLVGAWDADGLLLWEGEGTPLAR